MTFMTHELFIFMWCPGFGVIVGDGEGEMTALHPGTEYSSVCAMPDADEYCATPMER